MSLIETHRAPQPAETSQARALMREMFAVAVAAVQPGRVLPAYLPPLPECGQTVIIAIGKAAASMTRAAIDHYARPLEGLVLTRYGHGLSELEHIAGLDLREAGHPVPDEPGLQAAKRIQTRMRQLGPSDRVLALISGGGSSLLSMPAPGITLEDKQTVTRALLASGATIAEINCVRKHLSGIKGGRLALAAAPASVTTLVISDVAGDAPDLVASGPTLPDPTTLQNARRILDLYNVACSDRIRSALSDPRNETPKPDHPAFASCRVSVVARSAGALAAAAQLARAHGYTPVLLGDDVEGDATEMGTVHAALAMHYKQKGGRYALISGGELTVQVKARHGRGGPNGEYALALAAALNGEAGIYALACDTDGIDGTEDNAGVLIDPATCARARTLGLAPVRLLSENLSYDFFQALGDLVVTGPTRTNVNDFRAILIDN